MMLFEIGRHPSPKVQRHVSRVVCGAVANLAIIAAPLAVVNCVVEIRLQILAILTASSVICTTELYQTVKRPERLSTFGRYQYAALAGGLTLLLLQWATLTEVLLTGRQFSIARATVGAMMVVAGCLLRSAAIRQLNDGFRSHPTAERLAMTGVFGLYRHPSETGLLWMSLGLPLMTGSWWSAAFFVPLTLIAAAYRIHEEERSLVAEFGDRYTGYCARVGRWIPRFPGSDRAVEGNS